MPAFDEVKCEWYVLIVKWYSESVVNENGVIRVMPDPKLTKKLPVKT